MNSRLRIAFVALFGLIVILVGIMLLSPKQKVTSLSKLSELPAMLSISAPYKDHTVVFSNDRSWVQYNYQTGKSAVIGDNNTSAMLHHIDQLMVSPDNNYIIFHLPLTAGGTVLDTQLEQQGLSTNNDYWWLYNIATNTYQNFPAGASNVQLHGGKAYAMLSGDSKNIGVFSLPNLTQTAIVPVSTSNDFLVTNNGYLLTSDEGGDVYSTTDGVVSTKIFTNASLMSVTSNGIYALGTSSSNNSTQLIRYDLQTKSQTVIANDISGQTGMLGTDKVLYRSTGDSKTFYVYNVLTNKIINYALGAKNASSSLMPAALLDDNTFLLTDSNNVAYVAGDNVASSPKTLPDSYSANIPTAESTIQIASSDGSFIITLDADNATSERDAVYAQLQKDGYDPNIVPMQFVLFSPPPIIQD